MTQKIRKGHVILNDQADLAKNQREILELRNTKLKMKSQQMGSTIEWIGQEKESVN